MLWTADPLVGTDGHNRATLLGKLRDYSQIVSVTNTTTRASHATAVAAVETISAANPVWVYRQDVQAIEVTEDGTNWETVTGVKVGAAGTHTASALTATLTAQVPTISKHTGSFTLGLTGNYSILVPVDGIYRITVRVDVSGATFAGRDFVQVVINDATSGYHRIAGYGEDALSGCVEVELSAGDGIKFESYQASGTTRTVSGSWTIVGEPAPLWA